MKNEAHVKHTLVQRYAGLLVLLSILVWPVSSLASTAEEYLKQAEDYINKGEYNAAVIHLKNSLLLESDNAQARLMLGKAYIKMGDGASAEKEVTIARDLGLDKTEWLVPLGQAYLMLGRNDEVLREITLEEDYPAKMRADILILQGNAYLAKRELQEADTRYTEALQLRPDDTGVLLGKASLAVNANEPEKALALVERLLSREPANVKGWLFKGEILRLQGKHKEAVDAYNHVVSNVPDNILGRIGRATSYIAIKDYDNALNDINYVHNKWPKLTSANYLQAVVYFNNEDFELATETLQLVLAVAPDHLQSHLLIGTVFYLQDQLNQAQKHLEIYLDKVPGQLSATKILAATYLKLKQPDNAIPILVQALEPAPEDAQLLVLLGAAYLQTGDVDRGMENLEKAASIIPDAAAIRTQLGIAHRATVDLEQGLIQADALLILTHLQKKDYLNALKDAEALAGKMPDHPLPYNLLGATYLAMQDNANARKAYEDALKVDDKFQPARLNLARLDQQEGKTKAAERQYQAILAKDDANTSAMLGLSRLASATGDSAASLQWLVRAHNARPDAVVPGMLLAERYLQVGEADKALGVTETLIVAHPRERTVLRLRALAQLQTKDYAGAIITLRTLTEVLPQSPEAHYLLASALLKQAEQASARRHLDKALILQPGYGPALIALVSLEINEKNFDDALAVARNLQQSHPDAATGYELEGDIHMAAQHFTEAVSSYKTASGMAMNAKITRKLYTAQSRSGQKQEEAIGTLQQWLADHPDDLAMRMMLANALSGHGQRDEAVRQYQKILEADPKNLMALNNLAWAYQEQDVVRGLEYAEQAYELAGERPDVADTLGWLLVKDGDYKRGLPLLQGAVKRAPHILEIRYHLAVALDKAGRQDEARKELQRLLRSDKNFQGIEPARELLKRLESR